jgi:hypothetical protein
MISRDWRAVPEGVAMRIMDGHLLNLGQGKYVRTDDVVAIEPITQERGPGRRSRVWVRGLDDPLIAARAETSVAGDMLEVDDPAHPHSEIVIRATLERVVITLDRLPAVVWQAIARETGMNVSELIDEGRRALD